MAESWRMSDFGAISLLLTHQRRCASARGDDPLLAPAERHVALSSRMPAARDRARGAARPRRARSRQGIELAVGVIFRMFRAHLGPQWKPRACASRTRAAETSRAPRIFGTRVDFGQEFNGIVCAAADLDRPNPAPIPRWRATRAASSNRSPAARTRRRAGGAPRDLSAAAARPRDDRADRARLGVTPRTLQRQLEASGESFSELLDAARPSSCCATSRTRRIRSRRWPSCSATLPELVHALVHRPLRHVARALARARAKRAPRR
jgi:hypothetical protein